MDSSSPPQAESVRHPGKRFFKELSDDVFAYVSIGVEHKTLTEGLRRFVAGNDSVAPQILLA